LQAIDVSNNAFTGSISEDVFSNSSSLQMVNLNNNAFQGTFPTTLFSHSELLSVVLASNCFHGSLPDTICNNAGLEQLILDGLHSDPSCTTRAIQRLSSSGLKAHHAVTGKLPACLLQLGNLSLLHVGGNSLSGPIPNVELSSSLTELVLSSNKFTGSVPMHIWRSNLSNLDLSFNHLQGTMPSDMLPIAHILSKDETFGNMNSSDVVVKLQVNQLAGTIPSFMRNLEKGNVDILEGNLFSCELSRNDLPQNDPKAKIYSCGSASTNYGLIVFGVLVVLMALITLLWSKSSIQDIFIAIQSQYTLGISSCVFYNIRWMTLCLTCLCLIGMIIYGILSVFYSSYANIFVWTISAIYKTGLFPAIVMFIWLFALSGVVVWKTVGHSNVDTVANLSISPNEKEKVSDGHTYLGYLIIGITLTVNVVIVTAINGLYVSTLVSSDYTIDSLILITIGLSLFKIVWNFALVRGSHFFESLSDATVLGACLFNNILAPLIAEMFASSDCFLYIVSQAPAVVFNYNVYLCPTTAIFGEILPCSFPDLIAAGDGNPVELSIIPPFHYSYQCSFSLISSYVYVFIFRYIISGLIEPLIRIAVYNFLISRSVKFSMKSLRRVVAILLSPLLQALLYLEIFIEETELFQQQLSLLQQYIEKGIFRRRWAVLLVTDLSMLICFGVLFPPLAVVIAVSVIKDVLTVRLALIKYCKIIEIVQDEDLKNQMKTLKSAIDSQIVLAQSEIWGGVRYAIVMISWIWAFVLFDTLASSDGVLAGLCVLMLMNACPFIWFGIQKVINTYKDYRSNDMHTKPSLIAMTVIQNPITAAAKDL
jgi:hypothetical protein